MKTAEQVAAFSALFRSAGTSRRAAKEKSYLKSDLDFYGVPVPFIRSTARSFRRDHPKLKRKTLFGLVGALWSTDVHELRTLSIALLELYSDLLKDTDLKRIEQLLSQSRTWAHVDWLSIKVAGALVDRFPASRQTLHRWAGDSNFWLRRAAMLALLDPLRAGKGDFTLFAQFASAMIDEKEFFIRKAIGWILREVSKQRPELAHDFLEKQIQGVSGLTLREGSRYLSEPQRLALLRKHRGTKLGKPLEKDRREPSSQG